MKLHAAFLALFALPTALAAAVAHHRLLEARVTPTLPSSGSSGLLGTASSTSKGKHSTVTSHKTTSASSSTTANAAMTEIAVFTAADIPFTVTSAHGSEVIDGKVLTPGVTDLKAGAQIAEATKGNGIVANGNTIQFQPYTPSSSAAQQSQSAASGSGSAAASSSSSSHNAAAAPTFAVGGGAAMLGAVVGVLML